MIKMETDTIKSNLEKPGFPVFEETKEKQLPNYSGVARQQKIMSVMHKEFVELFIRLKIIWIVLKLYKNISRTYKILKRLDFTRRKVLGERRISKIAMVAGKYYWDLYTPGF